MKNNIYLQYMYFQKLTMVGVFLNIAEVKEFLGDLRN